MSDLIEMSKVKADDMDAIGQSGAANLLRMNVAELERLTAELGHAKAFGEATDASLQAERERLTARLKQCGIQYDKYDAHIEKLEKVLEAAKLHVTNCDDNFYFALTEAIAEVND